MIMEEAKLYEYAMKHICNELLAFAENSSLTIADNSKYHGYSHVVDVEKLIDKIEELFDFLNYKDGE